MTTVAMGIHFYLWFTFELDHDTIINLCIRFGAVILINNRVAKVNKQNIAIATVSKDLFSGHGSIS